MSNHGHRGVLSFRIQISPLCSECPVSCPSTVHEPPKLESHHNDNQSYNVWHNYLSCHPFSSVVVYNIAQQYAATFQRWVARTIPDGRFIVGFTTLEYTQNMSTEHAVTTKLCHWSNLQGGFLYHNSGERYVATRWHRIFWSKHNVMFQYVLVLKVKACQSHKVHQMAARPPLFARKSLLGNPCGTPIWWAFSYQSQILERLSRWSSSQSKLMDVPFCSENMRRIICKCWIFHCQVVLPMGKLTFLLVTMCSWVKSILWWQNPTC